MELTEREYIAIYNRAYRMKIDGKRGGWKNRDVAFSRLMREAKARKSAARTDALPDSCRRELREIRNKYGEYVTVEVRK